MINLSRAISFAAQAHILQLDQGGKPYILHCLEVMRMVGEVTQDEDILCAAVLHDVVEDCGVDLGTLRDNFGQKVATLVAILTKPIWVKNEDHYLANIKALSLVSKDASLIKMMDIRHNSDIRRLKKPLRDKDFSRIVKYQKAHAILEENLSKGA